MAKAMGSLITPHKENIEAKYLIYPTINLACRISIHSWLSLRTCILDFGAKYHKRLFLIVSAFLALYIAFLVLMLLNFFEVTNYKLSMFLQLAASFDTGVVLIVLLIVLYFGAETNELFLEHKHILLNLTNALIFIKSNYDDVIGKCEQVTGDNVKAY